MRGNHSGVDDVRLQQLFDVGEMPFRIRTDDGLGVRQGSLLHPETLGERAGLIVEKRDAHGHHLAGRRVGEALDAFKARRSLP